MEQKVIILFGSPSEERMVSVASAQALSEALKNAALWFWHKDGPIYRVEPQKLLAHANPFVCEFEAPGKPDFPSIAAALASEAALGHTFVLATHGGAGENGEIQSLLELNKLAFTGSNAKSSHRAFNKVLTKAHLANFALKMAPQLIIDSSTPHCESALKHFLAEHEHIIIKPICGGSSIGCHFVHQTSDIAKIVQTLRALPQSYLCEKMIKGRELTVGVIDTPEGPIGLPATEIALAQDRDFDYEGKYLGAGAKELTPAPVSESAMREAQRLAVAAHVSLELAGYSRSDMIMADDGLYYLETNTLPGLTKQSLIPQQLAAAHISLREFLAYQISLAQARAAMI